MVGSKEMPLYKSTRRVAEMHTLDIGRELKLGKIRHPQNIAV